MRGKGWRGCKTIQAHTNIRPTKSGCDSAKAKQAERSLKGKGGGEGRRIVRFWKGGVRQGGGCGFERVVGMADVWGWWVGGDGDRFTEKREVLLR